MNRGYLLLLIFIAGCLGPSKDIYPPDESERPIPVYLIGHGWHVGIAIEQEYINHLLPDHPQMPEAKILKFGWGDDRFYTESDAGFRVLARAALLPTGSVLHVVGMDISVENYFRASSIIKVQITKEGARRLGEFIAERFLYDNDENVEFDNDGLYTNSAFFKARGRYYFPKTSNTWTARALRQTGYPITPFYSITSGNVMRQAKKDGEVIR